ncbi:GNAT family N-acetyltransferase [Larkinella knui]|uniref:GNAT family N-acetyltransferase n=1 Tax=Larkinella knui TaxID=2025310 RepID=A0A3P1CYE3_9BACT|nr:GNAT family N-acetyltransferase [Larkinella knui]
MIRELDADLWKRYQPYQAKYDAFNKVDDSARVVIVFQADQPAGCGCYRPISEPDCVEIKRMFVKPAGRGRGLATRILRELEIWAAEEGYKTARLETGIKQPEALALYEKAGYHHIEKYGPYVGLNTSICLEKSLS